MIYNNYKFANADLDILQMHINAKKDLILKDRVISIFTDKFIRNKQISIIAYDNQISKVRVNQIINKAVRWINWRKHIQIDDYENNKE